MQASLQLQRSCCPAAPCPRLRWLRPRPKAGSATAVPGPPPSPQHCSAGASGRVRAAAAAGGAGAPNNASGGSSEVDMVEPSGGSPSLFGFTFADVVLSINLAYWVALLTSVLTGQDLLSRIGLAHFETYTSAMLAVCSGFTLYHAARFLRDLRLHLKAEARQDWRQLLKYVWQTVFWCGFVLWYLTPPASSAVVDLLGTPGSVMCLFGASLALAAALQVGQLSFLGRPQVPRRLHTGGVYALLRHPQALGTFVFLIGFSAAGGALWASAAFALSFALYCGIIVPLEERMLEHAFPAEYERYRKSTPRFYRALVLLALLQCALVVCQQPWATPIDASPPAPK